MPGSDLWLVMIASAMRITHTVVDWQRRRFRERNPDPD